MTQHVRTSYRRHRRAAWGLAIALAVAVAAVIIPIASGAPEKTYTILFPSSGAVSNPSAPVPGSTTAQTLCTNTDYGSVKFVISNTAKTASLGSVDVTFPSALGLTLGNPSFIGSVASGATITSSGSLVSLRGLSLPSKTGTVTFQVPVSTSATVAGPNSVTAIVKQSNDFSDAGTNPDANTFSPPESFPSLKTQNCDVTISGRVYHDRDQSGAFGVNANSPTSDVVKTGWTVTLQRKTGATTYTNVGTDVSDGDGLYSLTGQLGGDYRLCVSAPSSPDPDASSPWAVRKVATVTLASGCPPITSASGSSSQGLGITGLTASNASDQDFAVVPITSFDFGAGDSSGSIDSYLVTASGNSTKADQRYVQETWTNGGLPYFVFAPINTCTADCNNKIYLLETMTGTVNQSALSGAQVHLKYDDTEPFTNFQEMPYCLQDPRPATGNDLATTGVLPSGATSCVVEGHQEVDGDGTAANAVVNFTFVVYTSYDGSRGFT